MKRRIIAIFVVFVLFATSITGSAFARTLPENYCETKTFESKIVSSSDNPNERFLIFQGIVQWTVTNEAHNVTVTALNWSLSTMTYGKIRINYYDPTSGWNSTGWRDIAPLGPAGSCTEKFFIYGPASSERQLEVNVKLEGGDRNQEIFDLADM